MNLKELGEHFRIERERQGLTIDDVVRRTKISKSNVRALEDGDAAKLPHPVYAKGFVRNYAKLLGLDPEECAAVMAGEYVAEDNVSVPQPALDGPEQEIGVSGGGKSAVLMFIVGILAIGLVAGVMFYLDAFQNKDAGPEGPQPAVEAPAPQAEPAPAPVAEPAAEAPAPEQAAPEAEAPAEKVPAAEPPAPAPEQSAAPADEEPQAAEAAAPGPAQAEDGRQQVVVTASEACWIFANVDGGDEAAAEGGVTVDVVLQPGQSKQLRYRREMVMKLGNAGGVRVTLNGEAYPVDAQSGQVRTITFTAP